MKDDIKRSADLSRPATFGQKGEIDNKKKQTTNTYYGGLEELARILCRHLRYGVAAM